MSFPPLIIHRPIAGLNAALGRWEAVNSSFLSVSAFLAVCLSSCGGDVALPADQKLAFDPITFFEGHTHGEGDLRKLFGKPVHITVDSIGRRVPGGLILDQTIRKANGPPPSTRRWAISRVAQNRYTGTLTDAVGPVTAEVVGPRAEIAYSMRRGLKVEQQLTQQPGSKSVLNQLRVHKLGVLVATLTETITRVTP